MNRDAAIRLLDRLHEAQNEFYAGGSGAALEELLAANVTWTVPGHNRIAGSYRGLLPLDQRAFDEIWSLEPNGQAISHHDPAPRAGRRSADDANV